MDPSAQSDSEATGSPCTLGSENAGAALPALALCSAMPEATRSSVAPFITARVSPGIFVTVAASCFCSSSFSVMRASFPAYRGPAS